jgi:membrane-bound ClpP family serine protease
VDKFWEIVEYIDVYILGKILLILGLIGAIITIYWILHSGWIEAGIIGIGSAMLIFLGFEHKQFHNNKDY